MSIKSIAIATAVALSASAASADSFFSIGETLEDRAVVDLGVVRAEANGVVEVYDFAGGKLGDLLGTTNVNAGANQSVRVDIGSHYLNDVVALLKIDGQVVATQDYDINRD